MGSTEPTFVAPFLGSEASYNFNYNYCLGQLRLPKLKHFPDFDSQVYCDRPTTYHGIATLPPEHPHATYYAHAHLCILDMRRSLDLVNRSTLILWAGLMSLFTGYLALTDVYFINPATSAVIPLKGKTTRVKGWPSTYVNLTKQFYDALDRYTPPDFNLPFIRTGRTVAYSGLVKFGDTEHFGAFASFMPRVKELQDERTDPPPSD